MPIQDRRTSSPRRALVVVDVQNDFCEGGNLAVTGGADVAAAIADWIAAHGDEYDLVVATMDFHVDPGDHFAAEGAEPDFAASWPVHCLADGPGAEFHPNVAAALERVPTFTKGEHSAAYSGFEGAAEITTRTAAMAYEVGEAPEPTATFTLESFLRQAGKPWITHVDVVGIATDFCVKATALDAARLGFTTRVLTDLTAAVDAPTPDGSTLELALAELTTAGVELTTTIDVVETSVHLVPAQAEQ